MLTAWNWLLLQGQNNRPAEKFNFTTSPVEAVTKNIPATESSASVHFNITASLYKKATLNISDELHLNILFLEQKYDSFSTQYV
jgi:hypothetical protein